MSLLVWILIFSVVGGVLSVIVAGLFLLLNERWRDTLVPHLVSFATGAMLGAALLALLPHALAGGLDSHKVTLAVLLGILAFFLLEKFVLWRHCHHYECEAHGPEEHSHKVAGALILIGDGVHNLVDGVLIAAAFLSDFHLGVVTALAVAAHEIPQEVGDFAILLHSGYSRARALFFNVLSSLTTIVGALVSYWSLSGAQSLLPYVLAVAAASFIYIAAADLIPGLHKKISGRETLEQIVLILGGVLVIYFAHQTLH